jgi:hypothetical protein
MLGQIDIGYCDIDLLHILVLIKYPKLEIFKPISICPSMNNRYTSVVFSLGKYEEAYINKKYGKRK